MLVSNMHQNWILQPQHSQLPSSSCALHSLCLMIDIICIHATHHNVYTFAISQTASTINSINYRGNAGQEMQAALSSAMAASALSRKSTGGSTEPQSSLSAQPTSTVQPTNEAPSSCTGGADALSAYILMQRIQPPLQRCSWMSLMLVCSSSLYRAFSLHCKHNWNCALTIDSAFVSEFWRYIHLVLASTAKPAVLCCLARASVSCVDSRSALWVYHSYHLNLLLF